MSTTDLSHWATWREIHAQPEIWRAWGERFDPAPVRDWIAAQSFDEIWFCGAGTSAYIGDILAAALPGPFRSVPSTDLVAEPRRILTGSAFRTEGSPRPGGRSGAARRAAGRGTGQIGSIKPESGTPAVQPLVINFGRSGNSSESLGTLAALDALAPKAPRLHITCNAESALARDGKALILPEATHDAGFAMTSSFSTMLLTALTLFDPTEDWPTITARLARRLDTLLPDYRARTGPPPDRAVFLGTGPMAFAAREAALKVMELSAGAIPCLWDSTLGFRHGPKSFVTPGTSVTLFTTGNPYEADLLAELRQQFPDTRITALDFPEPPGWAAPLAVASAQVAGVIWADAMGLNVDNPFEGQSTLTRVVSGVRLHEVVR